MRPRKPIDQKKGLMLLIPSGIAASLYFWFVDGSHPGRVIAAVVMPLMMIYGVYAFFWEKKADTKAADERPDLEDGSRFNSAEWHQQYLEYAQSNGWDEIKGRSMKSDLCRRYRNGNDRAIIMFGGFFAACGIALLFSPQPVWGALGAAALGGACLFIGIRDYSGAVVRRWLRETPLDRQALEESYMKGRLLVFNVGGVSIGRDFLILFSKKRVSAVRISEISSLNRRIVRLKKYQNSLYAGDEYQHYLVVRTGKGQYFEIMLNEFQVEMALDELRRQTGVKPGKANGVDEYADNQIITP